MKRVMRWFALGLIVASSAACYSTLNQGRCDKDSDCGSGLTCDLRPVVGADGRCVAVVPDGGSDTMGDVGSEAPPPDGGPDSAGAGGSDAMPDGAAGEGGTEVKPQCVKDGDCAGATPYCAADGTCKGCADLPALFCSTRSTAAPACGAAGSCVACTSSKDCSTDPKKPICDTTSNTCLACTSDAQCVAKSGADPGVCMSHQDGRCATAAETIFVQNSAGCVSGSQGGTAQQPFCSLDVIAAAIGPQRDLIVVRGTVQAPVWTLQGVTFETSIVGQMNGFVAAGANPGLHVTGAKLFVRGVQLISAGGVGVVADSGSTLRMDSVLIKNCMGGGLSIDGSEFDIENTTIIGNGPGNIGAVFWGGILISNPPATGSKRLANVSVTDNKAAGVSCSAGIVGVGALVSGNSGGDVTAACGFTACSPAGPTCGAQ